jgi:PleD family two-component response regulator
MSGTVQTAMQAKTILVAVTDIFFYTKIRDALLPRGYKLERARTPQDLVDKAQAHRPAAVILNMNETAFDAEQALQHIKGQEPLKGLPVLAFANHEEVETWRRARELGITKIVSRNEFSSRTADLIAELLPDHSHPGT